MPASAQFVVATTPVPTQIEPLPMPGSTGSTASSSVAAVIGTLPGTRPVPGRPGAGGLLPKVLGGGSSLGDALRWLLGALRIGRTRATGMSPQSKRVCAYLGIALVFALGGQTVAAPAPTVDAPAAAEAGPHVAVDRVIELARAEIGITEGADGGTPYHRAYGIAPKQPWCAVFIWDVFQDAGGTAAIGPKTAYTPTMADWFRRQGRWSATPVVGALVFYDWRDRVNRIQHVELVESFTATTITTIGGNTSSGDAGSQDDGDGVWERTRPRNSSIEGYALPFYGLPQ